MNNVLKDLVIPPASTDAQQRTRNRWNAIAKPLGSLGALEGLVTKIAALTNSDHIDLHKRCVAIMCADNGVVDEGVSSSPVGVTNAIALNIVNGTSSICRMCAPFNIDCFAVDLGMRTPLSSPGIRDWRIAAGTGNIAKGPAMTRDQAIEAILMGIELVRQLDVFGYGLIGTGEMGIANTTTATAMACTFLDLDPQDVTGRGAGLTDNALKRKAQVIQRAIEVNAPDPNDPLDVLSKLGGFDIAGMCGMFLGGALHRVPVVMDGLISTVAAYCAMQLQSACAMAILPSHLSAEPAAGMLLSRMGMKPVIHADMRLGEGTGVACLVPLLDAAVSLYQTGATYEDCGLAAFDNGNTQ